MGSPSLLPARGYHASFVSICVEYLCRYFHSPNIARRWGYPGTEDTRVDSEPSNSLAEYSSYTKRYSAPQRHSIYLDSGSAISTVRCYRSMSTEPDLIRKVRSWSADPKQGVVKRPTLSEVPKLPFYHKSTFKNI